MSRFINGALYVEAFTSTGNPGEYTFENALFNNQADATGNGAYDVTVGFVIYVQATDINTGVGIPGFSNRYKITDVTYIDTVKISGTVLWDGNGEEQDSPTNGVFCTVSETTPNLKLAIPPVDSFYQDLASGSTLAAMLSDLINIMDKLNVNSTSSQSTASFRLQVLTNGQKIFTLPSVPVIDNKLRLTVNGLEYVFGIAEDFDISGMILTWSEQSLVLDMSDIVRISYTY